MKALTFHEMFLDGVRTDGPWCARAVLLLARPFHWLASKIENMALRLAGWRVGRNEQGERTIGRRETEGGAS